MYHMKRASLRDLRYNLAAVERLLQAREGFEITRRKRVIERLKTIYGDKRLAVSGAELLSEERGCG